jgi:dTDP-L-rhamnose 4-epimerase
MFYKNENVTIFDNGIPTRDFIYVNDIVDATIVSIFNNISNYKTYNVGTGIETNILIMAKKLKSLIGCTSEIIISDFHRNGDIINAKGNINKIKKELNWFPKYDIDYGLKQFTSWFFNEQKK